MTCQRLVPHTFDPIKHLYHVEGEFVLSTSAVIELNGLSDFSAVPKRALEHAGFRGTATHLAIQAYEENNDVEDAIREFEKESGDDLLEEVLVRMKGYYRFRDKHELKLDGEMEQSYVYRQEGTDQLIGGRPDLPCLIDGNFFILDAKTSFRNTGAKAKQDVLKWKLQLQSYAEILTEAREKTPHKAILHLHPECGKERGKEPTGFEFHWFPGDDSLLWDSAIRMAMSKLSHGYKLEPR